MISGLELLEHIYQLLAMLDKMLGGGKMLKEHTVQQNYYKLAQMVNMYKAYKV